MSEPAYLYCPECHGEYLRSVTRCIDCDVALVAEHALPDEEDLELPPAEQLVCIRVAPIAWIRALSDGLRDRGVAHRVEQATPEDAPEGQRPDVFGNVSLFGLYVQDAHAEDARELDGTMAARLVPEEAPPADEGEAESCPACGTPVAADAPECSDCGLSFG